MKTLILSAMMLAASFANAKSVPYTTREEAFKAVPRCSGPVAVDANRVARVVGGNIVVNGLGNFEDFSMTAEEAVDLKIKGNVLYALQDSKIQEFNLESKALALSVPTLNTFAKMGINDTATGMDFHGNDLVIAHGALGYVIYNTVTHKITKHEMILKSTLPATSRVTAVVVVGDQAIFSVDQNSTPGKPNSFFGFLVVDLKTGQELRHILGPDQSSTMMVRNGDQLIVGYDISPLHVFLIKDVLTAKKAKIKKIIMHYPQEGFPIGHAVIADSKLMTCFFATPQHQRSYKMPLVLDTNIFKL